MYWEILFELRIDQVRAGSQDVLANIASAVMTRAQTAKARLPIKHLKVPAVKSDDLNVDCGKMLLTVKS